MKCTSCHGEVSEAAVVCPQCGGQPATASGRFTQLKKIFSSRYDFIRLLGSGGFAEVYLGCDKLLEREVAIKILLPQHGQDPQTVERFLREARLYAKLEHKNIIPIYDTGILEGHVFITMKYIRGESLKHALLGQKRIPAGQLPGIISGVAQALDYIHRQGIIHRDIKPANIIVEKLSRAVYLADFGIARAESSQTLTQTGMIVGTPSYLSPEQIKGKKTDQRSDIYALGATLYELAAGEPPFKGDSPLEVLYQHINENAPSIADLVPPVDPLVEHIIVRCLEKDPARRFQDAGEILAMLDRRAETPAVERFEKTVLTAPMRPVSGGGKRIASILVLCAIVAGGVYLFWQSRTARKAVPLEKKTAAAVVQPVVKRPVALPPPGEKKAETAGAAPGRRKTSANKSPEKGRPADNGPPNAAAMPALPGTIRFSSFPPVADVYYAGEKLGHTEQLFEKKFPPGDYRFTFSIPGYRSADVQVAVVAGGTANAHYRFPPFRSFTITARPFGRVFIDGADCGDTPQTVKLAYGDHRVSIVKDGYLSQEIKIAIDAATKNSLFFELLKEDKK